MLGEQFAIGTRVIVWGRPEPNLVLLFGEGTYEGTTFINGNWWPTVRLTNGREMTVHQHGISIGRAEAVADTCKRFQGDVIEWDVDAFLRGEKPTVEQRVKSVSGGNTSALPPPKTATDKMMYLKQEIEMQEDKIKVAEKVIADARAVIDTKRKEIADMSKSVFSELASVNPDILKEIVAQVIAEQSKNPPPAAPQVSPEDMMRPIGGPLHAVVTDVKQLGSEVPPKPVVHVAVAKPDPIEIDHTKLATED